MSNKPKILIVDDNPNNCLVVRTVLKGIDAELREAANGFDALTLSLEEEYALILLDVQMPEMDGFEVCDQLRADPRTANTPIIFMTAAYKEDADKMRGYVAGATDYLTKPVEDHILKAKVLVFLKLYEQQRLLQELNQSLESRVAERTAQLEAANKDMEDFNYNIAHDLRAPLRAIDGFSQILLHEHEARLDDESRRLLNVVGDNAQKMGRLIDGLLTFSRIGRSKVKYSAINMNNLVEGVWEELQPGIAGQALRLDIRGLPPARGDHAMIRQVIFNLLSNAVKFTQHHADTRIEVGGQMDGNETVYYVKDNGVGFDMQYARKLFGVFQRLHGIDEFEGTGIGLAIIKRIITRHGGRVWAEGKPGEGATFYFALPT